MAVELFKTFTIPRNEQRTLSCIFFCDVVGSTRIKQQLGERRGIELLQRHHAVVRETLANFPGGEEINTAGDSFLILFSQPSDAVLFGLALNARLRQFNQSLPAPVFDRIGIHLGEVHARENKNSPKGFDLFGLHIDLAARVMSLGRACQILMTAPVFEAARERLQPAELAGLGELQWLNHGPYELRGIEEAIEICEIGESGFAPLTPPEQSETLRRLQNPDYKPIRAWRPAAGQKMPGRELMLQRKIGDGGFGEVWLAQDSKTEALRALKFCFQPERVRSLRREATLFRLLREKIGDHPNIVRLEQVAFDQEPFYVEMEYVPGTDLAAWCAAQNGLDQIPLQTRLEIFLQAANGLQAAHEAGVIHRDFKPSNILVSGGAEASEMKVKLTDFGIGQVQSEHALGLFSGGFTGTVLSDTVSSKTGTHVYMAPELLTGKPASIRSDIYSLGVVLYQLVIGDLSRPLTGDWAKNVSDPLLKHDIERCIAGNPEERFSSVGELARSLRTLRERRAEIAARDLALKQRETRAYRQGVARAASIATAVVMVMIGLLVYATAQGRRARLALAEASSATVQALLAQANLLQKSGAAGQRALSLEAIAQAAKIAPSVELRGAAIASLTLADIESNPGWPGFPDGSTALAFNTHLTRYARGDADGAIYESEAGKSSSTPFAPGDGHEALSLGYSSNEKWLAARFKFESGEILKIWDTSSKALAVSLTNLTGLIPFAFHPVEEWVALGHSTEEITLRYLPGGQIVRAIPILGAPSFLEFSPDGEQIAILGRDSFNASIADLQQADEPRVLRHHSFVTAIHWLPSGEGAATAAESGGIQFWDNQGNQSKLLGAGQPVEDFRFSEQGRYLVVHARDHSIRLWDTRTGAELVKKNGVSIAGFSISADGSKAAAGREKNQLYTFELVSPKGVMELHSPIAGESVAALAQKDQNGLAAAGGEKGIHLWQSKGAQYLGLIPVGEVTQLLFEPGASNIIFSGPAGLFQLPIRSEVIGGRKVLLAGSPQVFDLTANVDELFMSNDGAQIFAASGGGIAALATSAFNPPRMLSIGNEGDSITVLGDLKMIAARKNRGSNIAVFNAAGEQIKTVTTKGTGTVQFSSNEKYLIAASDQEVRVWEIAGWKEVFVRPITRQAAPPIVALAANKPLLAFGFQGGKIELRQFPSGKLLVDLKMPASSDLKGLEFAGIGNELYAHGPALPAVRWNLALLNATLAPMNLSWASGECLDDNQVLEPPLLTSYIGNIGDSRRQLEQAAAARQAIDLNPSDFAAHLNRANMLHLLGKYNEAIDAASKTLSLREENYPYRIRGFARVELRNLREAAADFENARRLATSAQDQAGFRESTEMLARIYLQGPPSVANVERGEALASEVMAYQPDWFFPHYWKALAAFHKHEWARALELFETARQKEIEPASARMLCQAICHAKLGNNKNAAILYKQALKALQRNSGYVIGAPFFAHLLDQAKAVCEPLLSTATTNADPL